MPGNSRGEVATAHSQMTSYFEGAELTMPARNSRKIIFAAMFANLAIAAIKFVAAVLTNSSAMLAEAIHSTADTGNELLLYSA